MQINSINSVNNTNFGAIKYATRMPNSNTIPAGSLAGANLKPILENSKFFKLLGAQTDVYVSAVKKNLNEKIDNVYSCKFDLQAKFANPYDNYATTDIIKISLPTVTSQVSEFAVRLEEFLKKFPEEYHTLLMNYRDAGKNWITLTDAKNDAREVFVYRNVPIDI